MWINFDSCGPFLVKIYSGGVNVISGENATEAPATTERRRALFERGKSLQDYIVTPEQDWLDGIATADGMVNQFVAVNMGSNQSIEAQMTGQENAGGLQIEVTPAFILDSMRIFIKDLKGVLYGLIIRPDETVLGVKTLITAKIGMPEHEMRLIFAGKQLEDGKTTYPSQEVSLLTDVTGTGYKVTEYGIQKVRETTKA